MKVNTNGMSQMFILLYSAQHQSKFDSSPRPEKVSLSKLLPPAAALGFGAAQPGASERAEGRGAPVLPWATAAAAAGPGEGINCKAGTLKYETKPEHTIQKPHNKSSS